MERIVFLLIIGVILFGYLLNRLLDYLNATRWSNILPAELTGIINDDDYRRSQNYAKENRKLEFYQSTLALLITLAMIILGGFAAVDHWAQGTATNSIFIGLLFFGVIGFASDLLSRPFDIYDTFVIEEKYGFNKTTPRLYFFDMLKGWLLSVTIGGGMLALIIWFYSAAGTMFWVYAWILAGVVLIFFTMFYATLITPLFNKQIPLPEGELRTAIEKFCASAGFRLENIFVIDGSKRSTKANAYFTGLGHKKRIVLYDTLINDLSTAEIVAVLAHEIGHFRLRHTLSALVLSLVNTGITLFIFSLFVNFPVLSHAMGSTVHSFHMGLLVFTVLYSPVSLITGLAGNVISRRNEFAADRFAKEHGQASALNNALRKLSVKNLSNLRPHPWYVFFHYSHPPLLQRLKALI